MENLCEGAGEYWLSIDRSEENGRLFYELYSSEETGSPAFPEMCIQILCGLLDGYRCVTNFYDFAELYLSRIQPRRRFWGKSKTISETFTKVFADAFFANNEFGEICWKGSDFMTATLGADQGSMHFFLDNPSGEYLLHQFSVFAFQGELPFSSLEEMQENALAESCDISVFYEEKQDRLLVSMNGKAEGESVVSLIRNTVVKFGGTLVSREE